MKSASSSLLALLATRQFFTADLYQFSLIGGEQLHYSAGDRDIVWNGVTWSAGGGVGPYFERKSSAAKCHWKLGVEVDALTVDVLPGTALIEGEAFLSAVRYGAFDGAEMTLYRAFMPTYGDVAAGTVILFAGRVAEIDAGRTLAVFTVNSHLELLNQTLPRNLYQAGCSNALYDGGCGLNQADYAVAGTVSVATQTQITSALPQAAGYFDMGKITFLTGANAGVSRTVKNWGAVPTPTFHMSSPFPVAASPGDAFHAWPGCDKQQATCLNKFSNLANFRGFPYIPDSATAV